MVAALTGQQAFIPIMLERALARGTEAVVVNTASAAGLANTAYTPNGTTDMAYTVAKNGAPPLWLSVNAHVRVERGHSVQRRIRSVTLRCAARAGVTLLSESLSASMRSRDAPISVHVLCPYGTQSAMGDKHLT
jgi:NAD(P)-dependent dehydrogenase (short-subunit alcohol dehydrogenase family)